MLTEKEIRTFIGECLGYTGPYTDDKAEWIAACRDLAAAIAKRLGEEDEKRLEEATWRVEKLLKEGEEEAAAQVVWEGEGYLYKYGDGRIEIEIKHSDGVNIYSCEYPKFDGQLVEVSVRKVEGTKDG